MSEGIKAENPVDAGSPWDATAFFDETVDKINRLKEHEKNAQWKIDTAASDEEKQKFTESLEGIRNQLDTAKKMAQKILDIVSTTDDKNDQETVIKAEFGQPEEPTTTEEAPNTESIENLVTDEAAEKASDYYTQEVPLVRGGTTIVSGTSPEDLSQNVAQVMHEDRSGLTGI